MTIFVLGFCGLVFCLVDNSGETNTLSADTVALAVGFKPNNQLFQALMDKIPEIHAIGDCIEPRKVIDAIWEAYRTTRLV